MSDIAAAIERAQGWLRAVKANRPSFVSDPVRRAREGLARLGPPSVGLAVAYERLHDVYHGAMPRDACLEDCEYRQALADWAAAQDGEERQ